MAVNKITKAYEILKKYNGKNNQILYLKYIYDNRGIVLSDFDIEYINKNYKFKPYDVNKIVGISSDFGEKLKEKYSIDFTPSVLKINRIIGEMGNAYHCYAQYRKSIQPSLMYVNKKYILHPLFDVDYKKLNIDFSKYDAKTPGRNIKEHQKDAIKFLLSNKKCILADSMGLGKTLDAVVASIEGGFNKILIITTASLKSTWKRELELYVDEKDIEIINGSKWNSDKKFVIINYDIIQNFYTVAEEPVFEEQIITCKDGTEEVLKVPVMVKSKTNGELVQKMQKTKNKKKIKECLKNSQLFNSNFECVIIDEAQKLSNNTSIRYKTINDFLSKAKPEYVFLVTGTPLTNKPINLYNILKLINADVVSDYEYYTKRYCGGKKMKLKSGKEIMIADKATNLNELREKIKHIYIRRLQSDVPGMVNKSVITKSYDLTEKQKNEYDKLWSEYQEAQENEGNFNTEEYKQLVEGIIVRQYLAKEMVKHTIELSDSQIEYGEKVIIICTFQEEIESFKKYYGNKAVVYDGKMTVKKKDEAEYKFMNDPNIKVFIGQIIACSVGLTLTASRYLIFNSYSWVAADNLQAQDRIYRLTQTRDVTCVYQLFNDSISKNMFDKVMYKELIMNETIKSENEKK